MVVGNTYKFRLTATRDGAAWDLTGATVTMALRNPAGIAAIKSASVTNAAGGIVEYNSIISDIATSGIWSRSWEITQGTIVQESPIVSFSVTPGLI